MSATGWFYADQFKDIHQRALQLSREFKKEFGKEQSAILAPSGKPFESDDDSCAGSGLIEWKGNANFKEWLGEAPSKKPPPDVLDIKRAKPKEEFIAWLMLPDMRPEKPRWFFGRVFSSRRASLGRYVQEFQRIASEAGKLLRSDRQYQEYLSPCIAHMKFAERHLAFADNLDTSFWCALLFTRPNILKAWVPWKFLDGKDMDIASVTIDDPFQVTADAIVAWEFGTSPKQMTGRFIAPHDFQIQAPIATKPLRESPGYSPWIDSPKMIKLMLENNIRSTNKRGASDRNITRTKKHWKAESQVGSNNQRFRFNLATLNALGIKYPAAWTSADA